MLAQVPVVAACASASVPIEDEHAWRSHATGSARHSKLPTSLKSRLKDILLVEGLHKEVGERAACSGPSLGKAPAHGLLRTGAQGSVHGLHRTGPAPA